MKTCSFLRVYQSRRFRRSCCFRLTYLRWWCGQQVVLKVRWTRTKLHCVILTGRLWVCERLSFIELWIKWLFFVSCFIRVSGTCPLEGLSAMPNSVSGHPRVIPARDKEGCRPCVATQNKKPDRLLPLRSGKVIRCWGRFILFSISIITTACVRKGKDPFCF